MLETLNDIRFPINEDPLVSIWRRYGLPTNEDPFASIWNFRFDELSKYGAKYGNCSVAKHFTENSGLAIWVDNQLELCFVRKVGCKSNREAARFGFRIQIKKSWDGHCKFPRGLEENLRLGSWVKNQKHAYRERFLNSVIWVVISTHRKKMKRKQPQL